MTIACIMRLLHTQRQRGQLAVCKDQLLCEEVAIGLHKRAVNVNHQPGCDMPTCMTERNKRKVYAVRRVNHAMARLSREALDRPKASHPCQYACYVYVCVCYLLNAGVCEPEGNMAGLLMLASAHAAVVCAPPLSCPVL